MAQMVKAVRMILGMDSASKRPRKSSDIEIEDDAPKRKPSLEEIDALEVPTPFTFSFIFFIFHFFTLDTS